MTAQGHPRAIFKRAIARGNVTMAEATARDFALNLEEALQLVLLYAAYEPAKAVDWLAPALFGLLGVLVGGAVTYAAESARDRRQRSREELVAALLIRGELTENVASLAAIRIAG